MNKTVREAVEYTTDLLSLIDPPNGTNHAQLFLIPPFTAIEAVRKASQGKFWVGAQNMHSEEWGPYTGEISAPMLQELGVDLVEIGHAERRTHFGETDADINRKVLLALRYGLRPLLCVGEEAEDKNFGVARETLARQLKIALHGVEPRAASDLIVAYEPVWAIGETGKQAEGSYIREVRAHLQSVLCGLFGAEAGLSVPVIYGGDVNNQNAVEILKSSEADGLFIGRAAWQAENFAELIRICLSGYCPSASNAPAAVQKSNRRIVHET